ncbi:MAG: hypothetical protein QOH90_2389, partial [Actinomycetota bacterium]|nr:hypothetical protein [Actinomycetota bacterium]
AARTRRAVSPTAIQTAAPSGGRAAAVLFLLLLPIAVAIGVLVGQGGNNNDDQLLAALKNVDTSGAAAGATTPPTLTSDFTLDKGFTVKLSTLPADADQAAADTAKSDAESKGAPDVGIITPADFTLTPADPSGGPIVYSGQFKTKGEAEAALKKLKAKFPKAEVVAVKRNASGVGALVAKTAYGDVHKVAGTQVTQQKVQQDTAALDAFNKQKGESYIQGQKALPDVVAVGGGGSGGGSGTSGAGD